MSEPVESLDTNGLPEVSHDIILKSNDKVEIPVSKAYLKPVSSWATAIEIDQKETILPVPINSQMLRYVVEYLKIRKGILPRKLILPVVKHTMKKVCVDSSDVEFVNKLVPEIQEDEMTQKIQTDHLEKHKKNIKLLWNLFQASNQIGCVCLTELLAAKLCTLLSFTFIDSKNPLAEIQIALLK